ncbi:MAG: R-phenyllactate dehydratase beta subunit [Syntrophaceae bacterium PtaU1.Bin231]|nr:MAG: R-phenyllactate dehydratase beta subunit [Syntrophaceae bacterium PtaU1.Bin231]
MNANIEPLLNDAFASEPPTKRTLSYIQSQREKGRHVVGVYCSYAPLEVIRAIDAVPAVLCAFANKPIETAEAVLPANLCPLIKSSYGFILSDTCPFFSLSEAVIAETTCDGKKKMFELISHYRPMFVMDLPQLPDEKEAPRNWTAVIRNLCVFLEKTFGVKVTGERVEAEIRDSNQKNRLMNRIFDFAGLTPPVITWSELYDLTFLATPARGADILPLLEDTIRRLEARVHEGVSFGRKDSPRVLITGSPVGGDAGKVFRIIEAAGGVIVGLDNCTGMKTFTDEIEEGTDDPFVALAERYLKIPCSCMSPNTRRLTELDKLIARFRPDAVIDVVLNACHAYNVESHKIGEHVTKEKGLRFLKIETDYSQGDVEQIRTRVESLFQSL